MEGLEGLRVQCPNCRRADFVTTDKYDPNVSPRGDMLKCTLPYHIDFLLTSSTGASSLTCPECLGQLAHTGCLLVRVPIDRIMDVYRALYPEDGHGENSQSGGEESIGNVKTETFDPEVEAMAPTEAESGGSGKKYVCEVCGKEAKSQLGLNSHMRSHGGNNV